MARRTRKNIGPYRSGLEFDFANDLQALGLPVAYEQDRLTYVKSHNYTPDFKITDSVYIETKGRWTGTDRTKMLLAREQNPDVTFILVFQDPHIKLSKRSKTTYATWCNKNGFHWCGYGDSRALKLILKDLHVL